MSKEVDSHYHQSTSTDDDDNMYSSINFTSSSIGFNYNYASSELESTINSSAGAGSDDNLVVATDINSPSNMHQLQQLEDESITTGRSDEIQLPFTATAANIEEDEEEFRTMLNTTDQTVELSFDEG